MSNDSDDLKRISVLLEEILLASDMRRRVMSVSQKLAAYARVLEVDRDKLKCERDHFRKALDDIVDKPDEAKFIALSALDEDWLP